jgi:hypothetical protein
MHPACPNTAPRAAWPRIGGLLTMYALGISGAAGCGRHPSSEAELGGTTATRLEESSRYGDDCVSGLLHVTATEAFLEFQGRRLRVVGAPPVTAVGLEPLLAQTALELRQLAGKRVRARGDLQGDILWAAKVSRLE